jgi:hypothetical protein
MAPFEFLVGIGASPELLEFDERENPFEQNLVAVALTWINVGAISDQSPPVRNFSC